MALSNFDYFYKMDKGRLRQSGTETLQRELKENNLTYVLYPDRAGPEL